MKRIERIVLNKSATEKLKVENFCATMQSVYGFRVKKKGRAWGFLMRFKLIALLGFGDFAKFLSTSVTTIGRTVYVPFTVGVEKDGWSKWAQIRTLAHECEHVEQYAAEGKGFLRNYVLLSSKRAIYESSAYVVNLELEYWMTGKFPNAAERAADLKTLYLCSAADVSIAEKYFKSVMLSISHGARIKEVSSTAIAWLSCQYK